MKKLFIVIMSLSFIIFLTSCADINNINDNEITLTYVIDDVSEVVKAEKDITISMINVPKVDDKEYVGLYLDENCNNEYQGEIINDDVTMYVKTKKVILNDINIEIEQQILETYLNEHIKTEYADATIDDVNILYYYGNYNGTYIVIMIDVYYGHFNWIGRENVAGVSITRPNSNPIRAWYNGKFYTLQEAYDNQYLTRSDFIDIAYCERFLFSVND